MRSALVAAMELNGDQSAEQGIAMWEGNASMQQLSNRTHAEDNVIRQALYEPKALQGDRLLDWRSWITQNPASGTLWASMLHISEQQLRHDADNMIYTDGSYETDTYRAGAGVYTLRDGIWDATTICPSKPGPVNTNNRAELIALLLYALQKWQDCGNIEIATDSQSSMQSINKQLRDPGDHEYHVHKHLLNAIADTILETAEMGRHTSLWKVKTQELRVTTEQTHWLKRRPIAGRLICLTS